MDKEDYKKEENSSVNRLFIPALVLSRFSTTPAGIILSLLLIEISDTFRQSVGVTGQISTASSIVGFLTAILMGALSVKYKHKSLLKTGLIILSLSLLCLGLAPSFVLFLFFSALGGLSGTMIMPMTTTLVAKHMPLKKRASIIGMLMATVSVAYLIGTVFIRYINDIGGWRLPYLIYALPFPVLSFLLVVRGLPDETKNETSRFNIESIFTSFRKLLSNKSADACLICNTISGAAWAGIGLYAISFYRQHFLISLLYASYLMISASLIYTLGALISSRFVNKIGRKPVTAISAMLMGIFTVLFTIIPNYWISVFMCLGACLFSGMRSTAGVSLTIEQVPELRGTMMSFNSASVNLGSALGSGIGGLALLWYGYRAVGPSLGFLGIISAVIINFYVIDPTQIKNS